jgi:hypothetical protein
MVILNLIYLTGESNDLTIDGSLTIINLKKQLAYDHNKYWFSIVLLDNEIVLNNFTKIEELVCVSLKITVVFISYKKSLMILLENNYIKSDSYLYMHFINENSQIDDSFLIYLLQNKIYTIFKNLLVNRKLNYDLDCMKDILR